MMDVDEKAMAYCLIEALFAAGLLNLPTYQNFLRMKREQEEEEIEHGGSIRYRELFTLAVATSIDALAVGVSFAFLGVRIAPAVTLIGCTTFVLTLAGVWVGNLFGSRYKSRAELTGGIILILIGLKILLEHLGVIAF